MLFWARCQTDLDFPEKIQADTVKCYIFTSLRFMTVTSPHPSSYWFSIRKCVRMDTFMWQYNSCLPLTGQQLSSMWQDNSCRACGRTTVVVLVTGQQLSCMWQDNSCSACDRTTAVHMKGQQLSCMWQDNSCSACDRTTAVVHVTGQQL